MRRMEYVSPVALARMQSDDSVDAPTKPSVAIGHGVSPPRKYDAIGGVVASGDDSEASGVGAGSEWKERWRCSSCDYNNRPQHRACKVCKAKRTQFMKTVRNDEYRGRGRPHTVEKGKERESVPGKIGRGDVANIPHRNYEEMLSGGTVQPQSGSVTKPPLMQFLGKESGSEAAPDALTVVASGVNPEMIPQRDYEQMLSATEIDDAAAFIPDASDGVDGAAGDGVGAVDSLAEIVNPQRDYHSMLNAPDVAYDAELEQEQLVAQMTRRLVAEQRENAQKETASYRSKGAVVPQRDYGAMLKTQTVDEGPRSKEPVGTLTTGH